MSIVNRSKVTIEDFGVFMDLREQGYKDMICGHLFTEDNGDLTFRFNHSLINDYVADDWVGTHNYVMTSKDGGRTWTPAFIIQRDPEGHPFNSHHCAMNGYFRRISEHEYDYIFGFFGNAYKPKLQRMLRLRLKIVMGQ